MTSQENLIRRLLVIDDNHAIHNDIRKVLENDERERELDQIETELFGTSRKTDLPERFDFTHAYQGQEGLDAVQKSVRDANPFHLAIVDMRMPPGWDGMETIEHLWQADPDLQVVICTAFSDYTWEEMVDRLGIQDRMLILKKPFDDCELQQMVRSLSEKRILLNALRDALVKTKRLILSRTAKSVVGVDLVNSTTASCFQQK